MQDRAENTAGRIERKGVPMKLIGRTVTISRRRSYSITLQPPKTPHVAEAPRTARPLIGSDQDVGRLYEHRRGVGVV